MKLPDIFPPKDLLSQVDGIEQGLRQGRRVGGIGWVVIAGIQAATLVLNSTWFGDLQDADKRAALWDQWPVALPVVVLGIAWAYFNWNAFWLQESKAPFKYTYWVDEFKAVSPTNDLRLEQLQYDLSQKLSQRISRLSRTDQVSDKPKTSDADRGGESHIHISGYYSIRDTDTPEKAWQLEVTAWVAVGPHGSPEAMAHAVPYPLKGDDQPQPLDPSDYSQLAERVYFSIATRIYKQIRHDVEHKITLLPSDYFRATAYLYEAEDYARSNTLDAYDEAKELFAESMHYFDSYWRPISGSWPRRIWQQGQRRWSAFQRWLSRALAHVAPRLAKVQVLLSKAEIGYAKMLLYRRALAALSGYRMNPIFEARPVAERAVQRLRLLPRDVPGQPTTLFDAYVTAALAAASMEAYAQAAETLKKAHQLQPESAEIEPTYLFVAGYIEPSLRSALLYFWRSVELDPNFEVAQFQLAATWDKYWRSAPTFEHNVASIAIREYRQVLLINPGNIAAWEALGYLYWLQSELPLAKVSYQRGREYKQIKRETFVAGLDQGLARIAAEEGRIADAFKYYVEATTAFFAVGVSHVPRGASPRPLAFQYIGDQMIKRLDDYRSKFEANLTNPPPGERETVANLSERERASVRAFVMNDFAEGCYAHFQRTGDPRSWQIAHETFQAASQLNSDYQIKYVIPDYNLHVMHLWAPDGQGKTRFEQLEDVRQRVRDVHRIEPTWVDGTLAYCAVNAEWEMEARRYLARLKAAHDATTKDLKAGPRDNSARLQDELLKVIYSTPNAAPPIRDWSRLLQTQSAYDPALHSRRLEAKADDLASQIDKLTEDLKQEKREVTRLVHDLLPHPWLWRRSRDGVPDLNWPVLRHDRRHPLRWERAFDDTQVEALFTWAICENGRLQYLGAQAESEEAGSPAADGDDNAPTQPQPASAVRGIRGALAMGWLPGGGLRGPATEASRVRTELLQKSDRLFDHIERVFWPENLQLLCKRRDVYGRDGQINARIGAVLERDRLNDPLAFAALFNLNMDPAFAEQHAKKIEGLHEAATSPNLSPFLYERIGSWLADTFARQQAQALAKPGKAEAPPKGSTSQPGRVRQWFRARAGGQVGEAQAPIAGVFATLKKEECEALVLRAYQASRTATEAALFGGPRSTDMQLRALRARARVDLARRLWALRQDDAALSELTMAREDGSIPAGWLSRALSGMATNRNEPAAKRKLLDWLLEQDEPLSRIADPGQLQDARRAFVAMLHSPATPDLTTFVRPIELHMSPRLFPAATSDARVKQMLEQDIPRLQRRVADEWGVPVPLPFVRVDALPLGDYQINLGEIPRAVGNVVLDHRFCRNAKRCRELGLTGPVALDPATGREGMWLADWAGQEAALTTDGPLLDAYDYVLRHLEYVVGRHVELFMGVQELDLLLADWLAESANVKDPEQREARRAERQELIRVALPDNKARAQLVAVMRDLLAEGISVRDLRGVLTAFAAAPHRADDRTATLEAVRLALRSELAQAASQRRRLRLSPSFEQALANQTSGSGGARVLILREAESATMFGALHRRLDRRRDSDQALIVTRPDLRPIVRRLVNREFPRLAVFSEREVEGPTVGLEDEVVYGSS